MEKIYPIFENVSVNKIVGNLRIEKEELQEKLEKGLIQIDYEFIRYDDNSLKLNGLYIAPSYNAQYVHRQKIRDAIMKYCPGMTMDHTQECDCIGCKLWKELRLD